MNLIDAIMCAAVYPVAFAMWYTPELLKKLTLNATGTKSIDAIGAPVNAPNLMLCVYTLVASGLLIMLEFIELFTLANAIANMYLIFVHPGFREGRGRMGAFRPVTRREDMTEEEREEYLRKYLDMNPELIEDLNSDEPQLTDEFGGGGSNTTAAAARSYDDAKPEGSTRVKPSLSVGTVHAEADPFADPFVEPADTSEASRGIRGISADSVPDSADIVPVLYDFEADPSDSEQISVKAGERLVLVLKQDDGWAQVTKMGDNTICIVPANYIGNVD